MSLSEFDLIRAYFADIGASRPDVLLGVGDDCALLRVPPGRDLAVSIDTLVCGSHFLPGDDPKTLGHKSLAVNLSDLAAMGAEPAWATLSLTLPEVDAEWLAAFSQGFSTLARRTGIALVGGDTTRGPLSISIQVQGFVEPGKAMRRSGARPGDLIYVSGHLGDAALALLAKRGVPVAPENLPGIMDRLHCPEPRLDLSARIRGIATACIDISDGLGADLGHICESSGVAALILAASLPLSPAVRDRIAATGDWGIALAGGDDYELCLTLPPERRAELESAIAGLAIGLTPIGTVEAGAGVRCMMPDGSVSPVTGRGYDHFR
ncbi:MAG: thiamine-phosphate kinase [Gammaproteobacteria bacterium]|nr:thiamine-phosphate kinase [Gammaproteobacteria bacterium]MBU1654608.1 thiamine-phosphate kinase [Gammaproteobacteria bacterium]MBU1959938.1 thiamine-phosphate kinase [Gammaproteobacteria bacterium]